MNAADAMKRYYQMTEPSIYRHLETIDNGIIQAINSGMSKYLYHFGIDIGTGRLIVRDQETIRHSSIVRRYVTRRGFTCRGDCELEISWE